MRILISASARQRLGARLAEALGGREPVCIDPEAMAGPDNPNHRPGDGIGAGHDLGPDVDAEVAFVSRDVTGLSTKFDVLPATQRFYDALAGSASLRWVHVHSAGADRPVYVRLLQRGVAVTTSSGANAPVVVQTALAGLLALARCFPDLLEAQRERRWAPLIGSGLPRDLAGQTALVVGWGPIGRGIAALLQALGLRVTAVRSGASNAAPAVATVPFERIAELLPSADWLVLACPLSARTRGLVDAAALGLLPAGARLVNVARGEVVDEAALIDALRCGRLAGAYLDVFAHEPLPAGSPLWRMPNVLVTPHTAGQSLGNEGRVDAMFLENLARWARGEALLRQATTEPA